MYQVLNAKIKTEKVDQRQFEAQINFIIPAIASQSLVKREEEEPRFIISIYYAFNVSMLDNRFNFMAISIF